MIICKSCGNVAQTDFCDNCDRSKVGLVIEKLKLVGGPFSRIDIHLIIGVLKNPFQSFSLDPMRHLKYGILGSLSFILCCCAWLFSFPQLKFYVYIFEFKRTDILFLIVSLLSLLGSCSLVGNWRGQKKLGFREFITYFGALYYSSAVMFLIASVCRLFSFKLSLVIVVISLVSMLMVHMMGVIDMFVIARNQRYSSIMLVLALYIVF